MANTADTMNLALGADLMVEEVTAATDADPAEHRAVMCERQSCSC